jgi:Tol biopolymer transport system component
MTFPALLSAPLIASLLLLAGAPASFAQKTAEALLQEGVNQELVVGDLQKAITLYRVIADRHTANRRTAAQALANLGRAYEKLGAAEATNTYQRLVRDFADQAAPVKFARDRLAVLDGAAAVARNDLRLLKVWESIEGFSSISPDGRYVAFQDWGRHRDPALRGNADVALYDTRDRRIRLVTNRPSLALVDVYPSGPFTWSPDGQWLAYTLHAVGWTHRELHVVRPDGRDDRRILDNRNMADVRAMDFASDNSFILAALKGWDDVWRIGTVSLRDSSLAIVKTLGVEPPFALSLSPDDRFIAYNYAASDTTTSTDIFVLAVDGSAEVRVAPHPAHDVAAFWTPKGERLVFVSNRSGQRAVWSVRWHNGAVVEEPELVYPHLGVMQLRGITRSGALYFGAEAGGSEAYEGVLDLGRDSTFSDVKRIAAAHLLANLRPAWSLDGTRVAWLSLRGVAGESTHVVVKTFSSGTERTYPLPFPPGDLRAHRVDWSADGRVFRVQGRDAQRRIRGSFEVDVESGAVTLEEYLRDFAGLAGNRVTEFFFVDDRQSTALRSQGIRLIGQTDLVLLRSGDLALRPGERAIVVRNGVYRIRSLQEFAVSNDSVRYAMVEPLAPIAAMDSWRLSPDGTRIAAAIASDTVMMSNVLHIVPLTGGTSREVDQIARTAGGSGSQGVITAVRWTPDGKSVLYAKLRQVPRPGENPREDAEIWIVDADGGTPRRLALTLTPYQLSTMAFHPDGRRVAFTEWRNAVTEAWLVEGMPWQGSAGRSR